VQFGLTYLFRNAPDSGVSDSHLYGAKLDQIRLAESLGFDDIWVGEHHFVEDGWLPSPLTVAAAIAATTTRVTIGTYATLAALYHPIRLAEDCAVVDNISGGRFLLGAALGYRAKEFEVLGVPYRQRGSRLEETLGILRRCWTEEVFSHSGRHYTFEDVRCYPKPTQRPIPIWVGAAVADSSVERAARLGDGWLNGDPSWSSRPRYIEALAAAGKDPTRPRIVGASKQWILATRDPERDWAMVRPHAVEQVRLIERWFAESGQAGMLGDDVDAVMRTLFLVDTPENVVREIQAAHEIGGFERHIHSPNIPGVPIDRANEALELFAAEVLPAVRSPGESPAAVS
jgi:alkanesulfonate monooxygenase SsuD/methylene tetrahydromethanopterin reductase-like flavin-dependent oxidoreductase (luciferase family)